MDEKTYRETQIITRCVLAREALGMLESAFVRFMVLPSEDAKQDVRLRLLSAKEQFGSLDNTILDFIGEVEE